MHRLAILLILTLSGVAAPSAVNAQTNDPPAESAPDNGAEGSAVEEARQARDDGDFDAALSTLEAALHADPDNGLILYERILTLEAMGEFELALQVIADRRDVIIKHPDVNDLAVVEQRLISAREAVDGADGGDGSETGETGETSDGGETGDGSESGGSATGQNGDTDASDGTESADTPNTRAIIAIAGGGVALVGGTILLLLANSDAADLACAGISPDPGCAPGELDPNVTAAEYDDRSSSITTRRIVGGVAIGLGAVALGWGLYDLLLGDGLGGPAADVESDSNTNSNTDIRPGVSLSSDQFTIGLTGQFH